MSRLTYEYVKNYIEVESESGCKLLSLEYKNNTQKLEIMCKCGNIYYRDFAHFKHQRSVMCNECLTKYKSDMYRHSYDYVKKYIEEDSNSGCILLSDEYIKNNKPLKILCKCGNEFYKSFEDFKKFKMCQKCSGEIRGKKRRIKDYVYIKKILESNCEPIDKDNFFNRTVKIKCSCGDVFEIYYREILEKNILRCRKCGMKAIGDSQLKSNEDFLKMVKEIHKDEYVVLEEYKGRSIHLLCRHNKCGHEWKITPNNFLKGKGCPICNTGGIGFKDNKIFKQEVYGLVKNEYIFLEEYTGAFNKIICKHNECGNEYYVTPDNFLRGRRCPDCKESIGAKNVSNYLKENKYDFEKEYIFDDLFGNYGVNLRFDFCVFDNNKNILCLIEYDGEFHYKNLVGEKYLKKTQKYDRRKNKYCKDNNLKLLRIPYTEINNIDEILDNWFKKINK